MGYHDNEATTKKAVADAQRFINDRERYRHALSILGVSDEIIEQVRCADFTGVATHARYAAQPQVPEGYVAVPLEDLRHLQEWYSGRLGGRLNSFESAERVVRIDKLIADALAASQQRGSLG